MNALQNNPWGMPSSFFEGETGSQLAPARGPQTSDRSPYQEFDRRSWASLASATPLPLTESDIRRLAGLNDPIDMREVDAIYRPLSALLQLYVNEQRSLADARAAFLREPHGRTTPFVIGIAGSVAVGKSTVARLLTELMRRWPQTPKVELLATDGFLKPNAELKRLGLMDRKGFPESYDRRALLRFLAAIKSGARQVSAPVYSHVSYDIVPDERNVVEQPDVLIVEGLNVLQPPVRSSEASTALGVSDFFDFSIYVDARHEDIKNWYIERFLRLREFAFKQPNSYFWSYANLSDEEAVQTADRIWNDINLVNLIENIRPTRGRATLVITKNEEHRVNRLRLRKL